MPNTTAEVAMSARVAHRSRIQTPAPPVGVSSSIFRRSHKKLRFSACLFRWLVVMALGTIVHVTGISQPALATEKSTAAAQGGNATAKSGPAEEPLRLEDLPLPVREMRDLILSAVNSGDIDELRHALEWNELRPDLGIDRDTDAIEHFRKVSADGNGAEILARLGDILSTPPAVLPVGPDLENNDVFVWPYLAEKPLKSLSPKETVDLYRIVPAAEAGAMLASGKWTWYRLAIGADGTWHAFVKFN